MSKSLAMSNRTYDVLKWIAQILLPALGTLYFALASIWGLPYAEQVVGTITAVDTFLGVLLGLSTKTYISDPKNFDGTLKVDTSSPELEKYSLEMHTVLEDLPKKNIVSFKVDPYSQE